MKYLCLKTLNVVSMFHCTLGESFKSLHLVVFSFEVWKPHLWLSESHGEEEEEDGEDDDEDDEGDEAEEAGEENDRPYNLRQRKTVQRYEAPPIGIFFFVRPLCMV